MMDMSGLTAFAAPYYAGKDIMHNLWHIELVLKMVDRILSLGNYNADRECLTLAAYFHGFIYQDEDAIRRWMRAQGYDNAKIEKTVQIAWESQRREVPGTLEGRILHDAHVLEGGKTYLVVKTLITGSVRGQTLQETLKFLREHVLDKNACYLPETIPLCEEMNRYTNMFYQKLVEGIQ